jgi:hypothetical protein
VNSDIAGTGGGTWRQDAGCGRIDDPDIFFPARSDSPAPALAICASCTVTRECGFLCGTLSIGWLLAIWIGGIAGDLFESMLKRQHNVKDARAWLPGFGGLLDRIDSLLIAVPIAVLFA